MALILLCLREQHINYTMSCHPMQNVMQDTKQQEILMSALHDKIGKRALELLPEWEAAFWATEATNIPDYCFYPDTHLASQWDNPEQLPFYEKYCMLPDGHCIPHGPLDSKWNGIGFSGNGSDPGPEEHIIRYYLKTILDLLRAKEVTESARFAGSFAHMIQDFSTAVHLINNNLLNNLFPPENGKYFFYHRLVDSWPFHPEDISGEPKLLGRTLDEAAFVINEKLGSAMERGLHRLIPFLTAIRDGRREEADRISQTMNGDAVLFTADLWHTLFCIAFQRFSETDIRRLSQRELTDNRMILSFDMKFDREPFRKAGIPFYPTLYQGSDPCRARLSTDPYPYEPAVNYAYDGRGNLIPLALRIEGQTVSGERGIATGGYGIATYHVPGNLFSELDVWVGVHPASTSDREMTFAVWCYEQEQPLMAFGKATRSSQALHFVVRLPETCQTISLLCAGGDHNTSGIWLSPVLKSRMG